MSASSPYDDDVLPAEHQAEIVKIRTALQAWLTRVNLNDLRANKPGARETLVSESDAFADLQVSDPWAFKPEPPYKFRRVLLSCVRCYWLALMQTCSEEERTEIAHRLDLMPPYQNRIPKFDGTKCVSKPGELSAKEYEGLMRGCVLAVVAGMPIKNSKDVLTSWRELADVGVMTWEERD